MKQKRMRFTNRAIWLLIIAFGLTLVLITQVGGMKLESSVTLGVATIVAIVGWTVSVNVKARLDLELKASDEVMASLRQYSKATGNFNIAATFPPMQFPPTPIPHGFWFNAANEFQDKLMKEYVEFITAQVAFREAIEENEMAVVELEDYYHYIQMKHDELSQNFLDINSLYTQSLERATSKKGYDEISQLYKPMQEQFVDQIVLCLDLKKELLNKFQSRLFGRTILPRKPLDDSKTLRELATPETVRAMIEERDSKFLVDDSAVAETTSGTLQ